MIEFALLLLLSGRLPDGCPDGSTLPGRLLIESGETCPRLQAEAAAEAAKEAAVIGKPLPVAKKQAILKRFNVRLLDGPSAKYIWPVQKSTGTYCGFVNAKNSYGGYTGWRQFWVSFWEWGGIKELEIIDDPRDESTGAAFCDYFDYPGDPLGA